MTEFRFKSRNFLTIIPLVLLFTYCTSKDITEIRKEQVSLPANTLVIDPFHEDLIRFERLSLDPGKSVFLSNKQALFTFDWNGDFKGKIDLTDSFLSEKCEISDFTWDKHKIYLTCNERNELLVFDREGGSELDRHKIDFSIRYLMKMDSVFVCYQSPNPFSNNELLYELIYLDSTFKVVDKKLPFSVENPNVYEEFIGPKNIDIGGNTISFARFLSDTVIDVSVGGKMTYRSLGFPKKEVSLQENEHAPVVLTDETLIYPLFYTRNSNYESLVFLEGEDPYFGIRNINKSTWRVVKSWTYNGMAMPPFAKIVDDYLVVFVTDEGALTYLKEKTAKGIFKKLLNYERSLLLLIVPIQDLL